MKSWSVVARVATAFSFCGKAIPNLASQVMTHPVSIKGTTHSCVSAEREPSMQSERNDDQKQPTILETLTVTVRVPKNLMDLVRDREYFGYGYEQFFVNAVRGIVSGELSRMPSEEEKRLKKRYGVTDEDLSY
jgi:hypothetical protein